MIQQTRVDLQVKLGVHDCPSLVKVFEGGMFNDRLYVVMNRAPGHELEKRLTAIPRDKIRHILDHVARAAIFLRKNDLCHRDIKSANIFVSDDFETATLLDVSVMREISDPVGVGTDEEGKLPVVATARYSPPEYLFRLIDPSPELWHALDVYQLGALLHDLIMRQPLFESEYQQSKENRYRFAWTVATVRPEVSAKDVDQDLVFLARRALDKDWSRRSTIRLEDFLSDSKAQTARSLQLLGLKLPKSAEGELPVGALSNAYRRQRLVEVARNLEEVMLDRLRKDGVTAKHYFESDGSLLQRLRFRWSADGAALTVDTPDKGIDFLVTLAIAATAEAVEFTCTARLSATLEDAKREMELVLPSIPDSVNAPAELAENVNATLDKLATEISRADLSSGG